MLAAVAAAVLSVPATASATTRVVDQRSGPYTTIADAILAADPGDVIAVHQGHYDEELWVAKDDLTLRGEPGTIVSETSPFVVSLMGARDAIEGITIAGGPGGVRIEGDGARLSGTTVLADTNAVSIRGAVRTTLDRVFLRATGLAGVALVARNDAPDVQLTTLDTSIVTGGRMGTGIDVATGAVGDTAAVGPLRLYADFVTVAGAPTALRTAHAGRGAEPEVVADYSVIHGAAPGLGTLLTDAVDDDARAFVDPAALDFHLREGAWAVNVIMSGHVSSRPAPVDDYDGVPRGGRPSAGAFQFVEHAPRAVLTTPATTVRQGAPVRFDASGSGDPDPGGRILAYTWVFGDGSHEQTTAEPTIEHVFAQPGRPLVTVRVEDQLGTGTTSATLAMTVTDAIAPVVAITSPRDASRRHQLRRSGRRRVVNVVKVAGRATDAASGVARVDVTLRRGRQAYGSKAALKGDAFSWHPPAKAKLARGRWTLAAAATDRAGNVARTVLHFTVT
jgi:PKD domain